MSQLPVAVQRAVKGTRATGDDYTSWVWFHASTQEERDAVDRYLLMVAHPMTQEAGTAEQRFRRLVDEIRFLGKG